jgi:hypothetical protein
VRGLFDFHRNLFDERLNDRHFVHDAPARLGRLETISSRQRRTLTDLAVATQIVHDLIGQSFGLVVC